MTIAADTAINASPRVSYVPLTAINIRLLTPASRNEQSKRAVRHIPKRL